jgi:hypothetical protein
MGPATLNLSVSGMLGLMIGAAPALAAVEQCRFILARVDREACYQRQATALAAYQARDVAYWRKAVRRPMFNRKRFELPKASYGLKGRVQRYRCVLWRLTRGNPPTTRARKQIAADSVDAVERRHDISCTVDPGHCSGARYERAAKHRSRHRAF